MKAIKALIKRHLNEGYGARSIAKPDALTLIKQHGLAATSWNAPDMMRNRPENFQFFHVSDEDPPRVIAYLFNPRGPRGGQQNSFVEYTKESMPRHVHFGEKEMTLRDHYEAAKADDTIPADWTYEQWAEWAFSDLQGKGSTSRKRVRESAVTFVASLLEDHDPGKEGDADNGVMLSIIQPGGATADMGWNAMTPDESGFMDAFYDLAGMMSDEEYLELESRILGAVRSGQRMGTIPMPDKGSTRLQWAVVSSNKYDELAGDISSESPSAAIRPPSQAGE
jgi:hypothetical protein